MHILLLSAGGGGGNILRSLKAAFRRDLAVTHQADPQYASDSGAQSPLDSWIPTSLRCPTWQRTSGS